MSALADLLQRCGITEATGACLCCGVACNTPPSIPRWPVGATHAPIPESHLANMVGAANNGVYVPLLEGPLWRRCADCAPLLARGDLSPVLLAALALGVKPTRALQIIVEGREGNPYKLQDQGEVAQYTETLFYADRAGTQPDDRGTAKGWAHIDIHRLQALLVAATYDGARTLPSPCVICARTEVPTGVDVHTSIKVGRPGIICAPCREHEEHAHRLGCSARDVLVADLADVPVDRGLAAQCGLGGVLEPHEAPLGAYDLHQLTAWFQTASGRASAAATPPKLRPRVASTP